MILILSSTSNPNFSVTMPFRKELNLKEKNTCCLQIGDTVAHFILSDFVGCSY